MTVWRMAMRIGSGKTSMFEECRKFGIASYSYDVIQRVNLSKYPEDGPRPEEWYLLSRAARSNLTKLAYKMKKGDIIYVKEGCWIVGRGVVQGGYMFIGKKLVDEEGCWWSHTVPVKWDKDFKPVQILLGAEQHTVLELKDERLKRLEAAIAAQSVPRALFARVGWMKYYDGPREDDPKPEGGGGYNDENLGHEVYNFHKIDGCCYSYFEPPGALPTAGRKKLDIKRIAPNTDNVSVTGVMLVFVAKRPRGRQVVVGWHNNATVFQKCQPAERPEVERYGYYAKACSNDTVLLPVNERTWETRAAHTFGNANICYMLNNDGSLKNLPWQQDILDKIRNYTGPNAFQNPVLEEDEEIRARSSGQGYGLNAVQRKAVEEHAMKMAKRYLTREGFNDIEDTSAKKPYDYVC